MNIKIHWLSILLLATPLHSISTTETNPEQQYRKKHGKHNHKPHHHKPHNSNLCNSSSNSGASAFNQQPGTLNQNFGPQHNGLVTTPFTSVPGLGNEISAIEVLPENSSIVTIGNNNNADTFIVANYFSNGALNANFGNNGHVELHSNGTPLSSVAELPDYLVGDTGSGAFLINKKAQSWQSGFINQLYPAVINVKVMAKDSRNRVVEAGYAGNNQAKCFALKRIFGDGTLDTTFGTNGIVEINFTDAANSVQMTNGEINGIAISANDDITVVGKATINSQQRFVIARLTPQGELDASFGTLVNPKNPRGLHTGTIVVDFISATANPNRFDSAEACILQPDGKIIVVGYAAGNPNAGGLWIALTRYNTDGSIDTSFGANGIVANRLGATVEGNAVALNLNPDGTIKDILVAGTILDFVNNDVTQLAYQMVLIFYTPSGQYRQDIRESDQAGVVFTGFNTNPNFPITRKLSEANAISIASPNTAVIAGYTHDNQGRRISAIANYNI